MIAPLTTAGAQRLREELEQLRSVQRPAVINAIAEARAADERFLYVRSTATNAVRAIPLEGGPDAGNSAIPGAAPYLIDVRHPDYAFYVAGDRIHRWSKPR